MHVLCDDESVIGRAFYVMEFVDGRVLWDQSLPGLQHPSAPPIYDEMNRVIAALHNVDVQGGGPGGLRQAGQLLRAARSAAGASSTRPPSPSRSRRWTG
jgi:aminoglycoside phosphotransferase (APT) family kinase protein